MDWNAIIMMLLGGTTVGGIVSAIWYRKQNQIIKESEATQADVEAQKAQIDLANLYKQNMLEMMEQFKKNDDNQNLMIEKLTRLEVKVSDIETYLNGNYHQWLADKEHEKTNRYETNAQ